MSATRVAIMATAFLVSLVFSVLWGLYKNRDAHREFGPQLPARVLSVTPQKKVDIRFGSDKHYRLATLEVTASNGKKWDYDRLPVKPEVTKGMGLHAWISAINDDLYYEKAAVTSANEESPWSPFLSWDELIGTALVIALIMTAVALALTAPFFRENRGDDPGPGDPDEPEPDDPPDPSVTKPYDWETEEIYNELSLV